MIFMGIVSRAWDLQFWFEDNFKKIPVLDVESYLFWCSLILFIMGFSFLIFFFIIGRSPIDAEVMSSPLFYLVLGIEFFFAYLFVRYRKK